MTSLSQSPLLRMTGALGLWFVVLRDFARPGPLKKAIMSDDADFLTPRGRCNSDVFRDQFRHYHRTKRVNLGAGIVLLFLVRADPIGMKDDLAEYMTVILKKNSAVWRAMRLHFVRIYRAMWEKAESESKNADQVKEILDFLEGL